MENLINIKKKYCLKFKLIQISTDQMYDSAKVVKNHENQKSVVNNNYTRQKLEAENEVLNDRVQKQNKAIYDLKKDVIQKNEEIAKLVRKEFFPTNLPNESRSQESTRRGYVPAFPQRPNHRK